MALFRKRARLEDQLAQRRASALTAPSPEPEMSALLQELQLPYERKAGSWMVEVGGAWAALTWFDDMAIAPAVLIHDGRPAASPDLVRANDRPGLRWYSVNGEEVVTRVAVPMDGFDRTGLLLALGALAREAGGEPPPVDTSADPGLDAALGELGLDDLGELRLSLEGDVLDIRVELDASPEAPHEPLAWWMLEMSNWSGARLALGDALSAVSAIHARPVSAQALAWGLEQPLRLARFYREST